MRLKHFTLILAACMTLGMSTLTGCSKDNEYVVENESTYFYGNKQLPLKYKQLPQWCRNAIKEQASKYKDNVWLGAVYGFKVDGKVYYYVNDALSSVYYQRNNIYNAYGEKAELSLEQLPPREGWITIYENLDWESLGDHFGV